MNDLPLFPLNTVLYPGMPLPMLHIFEERYRLMIGDCIEQRTPFGVLLIRDADGRDTDPDVAFYHTGVAAEISEATKLDSGRYLLHAFGSRRFRFHSVRQRTPYLVGAVEWLPEPTVNELTKPANTLRTLYRRYWKQLSAATGYQLEFETPPTDTLELTYWMAHRLQVESSVKQYWLEASPATRLADMAAALQAELALLPEGTSTSSKEPWIGPGSWN